VVSRAQDADFGGGKVEAPSYGYFEGKRLIVISVPSLKTCWDGYLAKREAGWTGDALYCYTKGSAPAKR
jgi:hypothetical protein